ncbi:hypothetical protein IE077_001275 [Cardiosporidium cionae]|uniref:RRM domain-containing protein n=1 Tax=Cardiosporidium cionae TaxID=476202 RepID=A0ABQ7JDI4_9APIC|nr:hypothetical protein IE077_001275 [Cardiosporidium cionae]|eukprot:KAF8821970.1 hypothetical protein IE077_001275 [Cardiosporidium cionae]
MLYSNQHADSAEELSADFDLYDGILPSVLAVNTSATFDCHDTELKPELLEKFSLERAELDALSTTIHTPEESLDTNESTCFTVDLNTTDTKKWKFRPLRHSHKPLTFIRNDVLLFLGIPPILLPREDELVLPSTTIVIRNIGWWVNDVELRKEAMESGYVRALKIFDRDFDGRSMGVALIEYMKPEDAERSLRNLNRSKLETLGNRPISGEMVPEELYESLNRNPIHWSLGGPISIQQMEELYEIAAIPDTMGKKAIKGNSAHTASDCRSPGGDASATSRCPSIAQPHPQFPWFNPAFLNEEHWKKKRKRSRQANVSMLDDINHQVRSHSHKKKKKKMKRYKERKKFVNSIEADQVTSEVDSFAHAPAPLPSPSARFHGAAVNAPHVRQFVRYPMAGIPRRVWPARGDPPPYTSFSSKGALIDPSLSVTTGSGIQMSGQLPVPAYARISRPAPQGSYPEHYASHMSNSGYLPGYFGYPPRECVDRNEDVMGFSGYLENSAGWDGYCDAAYLQAPTAPREEWRDSTYFTAQHGIRTAQGPNEFHGNRSSSSLGHY